MESRPTRSGFPSKCRRHLHGSRRLGEPGIWSTSSTPIPTRSRNRVNLVLSVPKPHRRYLHHRRRQSRQRLAAYRHQQQGGKQYAHRRWQYIGAVYARRPVENRTYQPFVTTGDATKQIRWWSLRPTSAGSRRGGQTKRGSATDKSCRHRDGLHWQCVRRCL